MTEKHHMDINQDILRQAGEFDEASVVLGTVDLEDDEAVKQLKDKIDDLSGKLEPRYADFQKLAARQEARESQIAELRDTFFREQAREEIKGLQEEKKHLNSLPNSIDFELESLRSQNAWLMQLIKELEIGITELLRSNRWKIGNALGELKRKLLFRPPQPMATDYIEKVLREYRNGSI